MQHGAWCFTRVLIESKRIFARTSLAAASPAHIILTLRMRWSQELKSVWDRFNGALDSEKFRQAFTAALGEKLGKDFASRITYLFKKMDTNHDRTVDWDEFVT